MNQSIPTLTVLMAAGTGITVVVDPVARLVVDPVAPLVMDLVVARLVVEPEARLVMDPVVGRLVVYRVGRLAVGPVVIQEDSAMVVCMEEGKYVSGVAAVSHMGIAIKVVVIMVALAATLLHKPKPTKPNHKIRIRLINFSSNEFHACLFGSSITSICINKSAVGLISQINLDPLVVVYHMCI